MKLTQLSTKHLSASFGQAAKTWVVTLAAGAMLAVSAQADMYRPGAAAGGIQMTNFNVDRTTYFTNGTSVYATVYYHGLQAPYMVQMTTNAGASFTDVGLAKLMAPNFSSSVIVPVGSVVDNVLYGFRLQLLGATNWLGKWNYSGLDSHNAFAGATRCNGCHSEKLAEWSGTKHALALDSVLNATGGFLTGASNACLKCHSLGNGQPGGFVSRDATPNLGDVGCEACHGAASSHVNISGRQYHPAVTIAPELCGGCHTGPKQPTYEEYLTTKHAQVNDDVKYGFSGGVYYPGTATTSSGTLYGYYVTTNADLTLKTNATTGIVNSLHVPGADLDPGQDRQVGCGICHSAATRSAMIQDYEARQAGYTNALVLPSATDAASWSAACATCHDPHADENPAQLRNPLWSTSYYTMPTTADKRIGTKLTDVSYMSAAFANTYNPNVQVCAQCHNSRGARWDGHSFGYYVTSNMLSVTTNGPGIAWGVQTNISFSRPPHHSPQYNVYSGIVQDDYLNKTTNITSPHFGLSSTSGNTNQCVTCHMPSYAVNSTTNVTGHTFELNVKGCAMGGCHTSYSEFGLLTKIEERQKNASNSIVRIVSLLNQWGTTKAPALGLTKGANNWEYTMPGILASTGYNTNGAGPSAAQQLLIPANILKARFNLYMVQHDGSMGVHNVTYSDFLLRDAETNITSLFPLANFRASTTAGYTNLTVAFTNLGVGITNYSWTFGDGSVSTSANPSYTYTTPGFYTVTFTANGTETMTRTNYIQAVVKPTVSFTASQAAVLTNATVTFTNTSTDISDVGLWRWTFTSSASTNSVDAGGFAPTFAYKFTNGAGIYSVALRASTPVGNSGRITTTITNMITVTNAP